MTTARFRPRDAYRGIRAYDLEPVQCEIELADNTSPFGPPPAALRVVNAARPDDLARYPSTYSKTLRAAIARYVGVAPEEVMVGAGSDEVMSCAFRALADPGRRVAYMEPTFVMARVFAATNSLTPLPVPLTAGLDADADGILATGADVVYLCTPNNPTGTAIHAATLERIVREARGVVMVDEAYAEFAGTNLAGQAPGREGMLVLRTFSKAFGLAGLRIGYAVGARPLIAELEKARGPYAVTSVSEQAATAALDSDLAWVAARVAETLQVRDEFLEGLRATGHRPLPSAANFVLVPVGDSGSAMRALLERGILVRQFHALPGIGDALRISIGQRPVMQCVVGAMEDLVPCA